MSTVGPRLSVLGDACAYCSNRIKPGDFLLRVQSMSYTGYMQTEMCAVCFFNQPSVKTELTKLIKEVQSAVV